MLRATCKVNKAELIDKVYEKIGGTKKNAEGAVETVFETIIAALAKGEEAAISGFGTFLVKNRSARMGVNPRTGEKIHVAETQTPKFRAGKGLKEAVK